MNNFKVMSSNANATGGFVTKLQRETLIADEIFGDKKKSETYYISGTKQLDIDTEIEEKHLFPKFRVKEYPMINPETKEEFIGKWLHLA